MDFSFNRVDPIFQDEVWLPSQPSPTLGHSGDNTSYNINEMMTEDEDENHTDTVNSLQNNFIQITLHQGPLLHAVSPISNTVSSNTSIRESVEEVYQQMFANPMYPLSEHEPYQELLVLDTKNHYETNNNDIRSFFKSSFQCLHFFVELRLQSLIAN